MLGILITVIPVFLVIGAGYAAVRARLFPASGIEGLMLYTQGFAVPCLLFQGVVTLDLGAVFDARLLFSFYAAAFVCFALGILGARQIFRRKPDEAVAIGFGALFSNSLLLGLPIMERAFGAEALAPNFAIIAIHAPLLYLVGITVMEFSRAGGRGLGGTIKAVLKTMFRNALMIGLMLGLALNVAGLVPPEPVTAAVKMVAQSALPAALFGLGGVLTRYALRDSLGEATMVSFLSLILHPALGYILARHVFDLPQGFINSLVMTAAMAPGVNAYVFASMYDRGKGAAASAVLLATGLSVITASGWLWVLGK